MVCTPYDTCNEVDCRLKLIIFSYWHSELFMHAHDTFKSLSDPNRSVFVILMLEWSRIPTCSHNRREIRMKIEQIRQVRRNSTNSTGNGVCAANIAAISAIRRSLRPWRDYSTVPNSASNNIANSLGNRRPSSTWYHGRPLVERENTRSCDKSARAKTNRTISLVYRF